MSNNQQQDKQILPEDYLVASLLDYFRSPKSGPNFLHAAHLAQAVLARNSLYTAPLLEKRFKFLASALKNNVTINSLRDFAQKCQMAATKAGACKNVTESAQPTLRMLKKHAKEELSSSLRMGHSEGASVNRAAYELFKKQRVEMAKTRMRDSIRTHPLRETLEGLMVKDARVAKEDIRQQLLRLKRPSTKNNAGEGVLYGLLRKAQAFSAPRVHRLLGDELFFLCRPAGFMDQKGTTVVVEVPTSAHLHALTYRKLEILRALKADTAFLLANKVHLKIKL